MNHVYSQEKMKAIKTCMPRKHILVVDLPKHIACKRVRSVCLVRQCQRVRSVCLVRQCQQVRSESPRYA